MAKITRVNGNVKAFGSSQGSGERTLFGQTTVSDDLTAQFTAEFLRGWGIVGASDFPKLQDFNAATFTNGQLLAYIHQMGIPEYNSAQEFYLNSVTQYNGQIYMSIQNGNTGRQPNTNPTWWKNIIPQLGTAASKDAQVDVGIFPGAALALVGSGGIGGATIPYASSIDNLTAGQLFSTGPGSATLPQYAATAQGQGIYIHLNANFGYMRWTEITTGISFERQKISGTWQAWGECYGQVSCDFTGVAFPFFTNAAPPGFVKANGAALSRTAYARLFAKYGTLHGAGDGTTTFNVPDLRAEMIRGLDDGRGIDAGRVIGSFQKGSLISYDPTTISPVSSGLHSTASDLNTRVDLGLDVPESPSLYPNADVITGNGTGTFSIASAAGVARPRNVAALYCIKF